MAIALPAALGIVLLERVGMRGPAERERALLGLDLPLAHRLGLSEPPGHGD